MNIECPRYARVPARCPGSKGPASRSLPVSAASRFSAGWIPGDPAATTVSAADLCSLMDRLGEIYPLGGREPR